MTTRKHGGPRPNSGGARTGAGRKPGPHQPAVRLYVPVQSDDEAQQMMALPPDERRRRLLTPRPAPAPGGGGEDAG